MSTQTVDNPTTSTAASGPRAAFNDVIGAALQVAAAKVDDWAGKLEGLAAGGGSSLGIGQAMGDAGGGGALEQAGTRGVAAGLRGDNPVWAAVKGAWAGGSTPVKAAIVAAGVTLVLLLLLSPVLLLVVLLTALVAWITVKARQPRT